MDFEKLYIETFSRVRSSEPIDMEELMMTRKTARVKRLLVIAAAAAVFAALCLTAYATDFLGLQSFIINRGSEPKEYYDFKAPTVEPPTVDNSDVLSLQGYAGTPESQAALEWLSFYDSYDPGPLDNEPSELWDEYGLYPVYDRTMADKLEEILSKYGLKKHSRMEILDYYPLSDAIGGDIYIGNDHLRNAGYIYEDGSFHTDADYAPAEGAVAYQLVRCVKGSFTGTALYIGDGSEYSQWQYECQGHSLTMALKDDHALVMADLGECFVTLNVLSGSEEAFTEDYVTVDRAMLEKLCDNLDWGVLAKVITPDLDAAAAADTQVTEPAQPDVWEALPGEYAGYAGALRQAAASWGYMTLYALYDMDGDGNEELLIQEGFGETDTMWSVLSPADGTAVSLGWFPGAHATLYPRAEGGLWLVQGMMDQETVSVITLDGGLVRQEIVSQREVDFQAGEEYTRPADEELPLAFVDDLSLFGIS